MRRHQVIDWKDAAEADADADVDKLRAGAERHAVWSAPFPPVIDVKLACLSCELRPSLPAADNFFVVVFSTESL